jgi:hypothetical protein
MVYSGSVILKSIEWFTEDQAFSPSYDLRIVAFPTPSPSPVSKPHRPTTHTKTEKERKLAAGREVGAGAKSYCGEKSWSSIKNSMLSVLSHK